MKSGPIGHAVQTCADPRHVAVSPPPLTDNSIRVESSL
jgi:hypothetical protein